MEMQKRFYVGCADLRNGKPPLKSYEEAVADAQRILSQETHMKERYIVQVVAVVKRVEQPLIVELVTQAPTDEMYRVMGRDGLTNSR
jgi:hypothetical protein